MELVKKKSGEKRIIKIRDQIEKIDINLLSYINKRMIASRKIGQIKKELNCNVFDLRQEKKVKSRYKKLAKQYELDEKFVERICELILSESKRIQRR